MFKDVTLTWGEQSYTVPANEQMGLILVIEDALAAGTGRQAIGILLGAEGPSYARLATAYGAALRYAGSTVTDDEIYLSIMEDMAAQSADVAVKVQGAIIALLSIIAPPIGAKMAAVYDGGKGGKK